MRHEYKYKYNLELLSAVCNKSSQHMKQSHRPRTGTKLRGRGYTDQDRRVWGAMGQKEILIVKDILYEVASF